MAYLDDAAFVLNIQPIGLPTIVRLSQNENGRRLYFTIIGNETAIPSGVTVTLSGTKPDGVVYSKVGSISNGVVLIKEDTQLTAAAGNWDAKIKIVSGGQTVATGRVRFIIDADPVAPGSVPSDSQLEGLVAEAEWYAENARSAAYGSPLTAATVAGMTDQDRVYVYTGSETGYTAGNWYYWNGSAWTSGGVYNSTALQTDTTLAIPGMAADAKATGDAIDGLDTRLDTAEDDITDVKSDLSLLEADLSGESEIQSEIRFTYGYYINVGSVSTVDINSPVADYRYKYAIIDCVEGDKFLINAYGGNAPRAYCFINANNAKISASDRDVNVINQTITAPANSAKIIIQDRFTESNDLKSYKITETEGIGENFVRFDKAQDKTDEEKAQARENMGIDNGLSDEAKTALLACFAHVAWTDEHGQDYYDALEAALYDGPVPPAPSDVVYKLSSPFYSSGDNSIDTGFVFEPNTGKYTMCMKFIVPVDTPNNDGRIIFSSKFANASGYNYYNIAVLKYVVSQTYRMMYGWGLPWDETTGAEGKYVLGALYSVVIVVDTDVPESTTYIYNTHTETKYTYDKSLNSALLFNDQSIVIGKELIGTATDGFVGMVCDFLIKNKGLTETELNDYLYADIEKEDIVFEIGDISNTTGQNVAQPLRIRTRDYIEVSDSIVTTVGCPFAKTWYDYHHDFNQLIDSVQAFRCYDSAKTYLGSVVTITNATTEETSLSLPTGTKYIRVIMQNGVGNYISGFSEDATFPYYINGKSYRLVEE